MAKIVRHLREKQIEFQKIFSKLCNSKSAWQVWSDFVEMTAIAISNSVEVRQEIKKQREDVYLNIVNSYTQDEKNRFPEMLGVLVMALEENPEQDFLGEMFMALELGSHWHGQFFTPYNLCALMAKIDTENAKELVDEQGYVTVNDPACGAGATLIGARNQLTKVGIGGSQAFFVGQDISKTAALMCYVQLSLLGCAGYVVIADTLLHPVTGPLLWPNLTPEQDGWFMPCNYIEPAWVIRQGRYIGGLGLLSQNNEQKCDCCREIMTADQDVAENICDIDSDVQDIETIYATMHDFPATQTTENGQLMLF